jgi:hypothetical protein
VASSHCTRIRAALVAASLAVLGIAAGGCGGSDDSGDSQDARAQFDRALAAFSKLESADLDLSLEVDVEGDESGSFSLGLTGPFQSGENGGADLHLTGDSSLEGSEGSFDVGLVATSRNFYVTYDGSTYELGAAQLERLEGLQGMGVSTNLDFTETCRMQLRQSGADPALCERLHPSSWIAGISDEGQETIGGVETDHLRAEIDVRKLFADIFQLGKSIVSGQGVPLGGFDPERIAGLVDNYVDKAEISVYPAADDGIPRKVGADFSIDAGDSGRVEFVVDATFDRVNEPQTIEPPPGPVQPIQALADRLPQPFRGLIACVLTAKSQAELNTCAAGIGAFGAPGIAQPPSLQ